ncbi:hypothetical protein KR009_010944 [Drosophila setifemur]|nr:hypothetical protein KR009_010944 [Drosophila setifemur]
MSNWKVCMLNGFKIPHLAPGPSVVAYQAPLDEPQEPSQASAAFGFDGPGNQSSPSDSPGSKAEAAKRKAEEDLAWFPGRDKSYPDELNRLIRPQSCDLCRSQMTSLKCAREHYESKAHDRHISAWLARNYTDAGLQAPPVKRLLKEGPVGPNAFHCDLCDLALTSTKHARQHYMGRKHKMVEQRFAKPSGAGGYDESGKWKRLSSKSGVPDGRYGIGTAFLQAENSSASVSGEGPSVAAASAMDLKTPIDGLLSCSLCNIVVTSACQMKLHVGGARHQKILRTASQDPDSIIPVTLSELDSATADGDLSLSMYRTPTGLYYCKPCNKILNHVTTLQQHLQGKKHRKIVKAGGQESSPSNP